MSHNSDDVAISMPGRIVTGVIGQVKHYRCIYCRISVLIEALHEGCFSCEACWAVYSKPVIIACTVCGKETDHPSFCSAQCADKSVRPASGYFLGDTSEYGAGYNKGLGMEIKDYGHLKKVMKERDLSFSDDYKGHTFKGSEERKAQLERRR